MKIYRAVREQYVLGVHMTANSYIGLSEANEKELKLGKFAVEVPDKRALERDPKSTAKIKKGYSGLELADASEVRNLEGHPVDEGFVLYPPPKAMKVGDAQNGAHGTVWQETR